jgi:predicted DNA-binding protein
MKKKSIKPKEGRFVRMSDKMWQQIINLASEKDMCASEYIRRIIEEHLEEKIKGDWLVKAGAIKEE